MATEREEQLIELIATDRVFVPVSSMKGKLDKLRPKLAKAIDLKTHKGERFVGDRVYARIEKDKVKKAKDMRAGIEQFSKEFPKHGKILNGYIERQREKRETHFYFGVNLGCRLTEEDYMSVMRNLGYTEALAQKTLPGILDYSRRLSRKRQEERSVLIG